MSLDKHIVILGFMAVGKSTVGAQLATMLDCSFVDTDRVIEDRAGMAISQIFKIHGEDHFRDLEHRLLVELLQYPPSVIATGGGMPCHNNNIDIITSQSISVNLRLGTERIVNRLQNSNDRPLASGLSKGELRNMVVTKLRARRKYYNKAEYQVRAIGSAEEIASRILTKLKLEK